MAAKKDNYVEGMKAWAEQRHIEIESCDNSIEFAQKEIMHFQQFIYFNRRQKKYAQLSLKKELRNLKNYQEKYLKKPQKITSRPSHSSW